MRSKRDRYEEKIIRRFQESKERMGKPGNEFYNGVEYPWPKQDGGPSIHDAVFFEVEGVDFSVMRHSPIYSGQGYLVQCLDCEEPVEHRCVKPSHCIDEHLRTEHEPTVEIRKPTGVKK